MSDKVIVKTEKPRKKSGPKERFQITDEVLKEITQLGGLGFTQMQIAAYYGIRQTSWAKLKKEREEVQLACQKGKYKAVAMVASKLMELVRAGNVTAIIFYLKTQGGWCENKGREIEELPGASKVIDAPKLAIGTTDPIEASKVYQQIMGE